MSQSYTREDNAIRHKKDKHAENITQEKSKTIFTCPSCFKTFSRRSNMESHKRTHDERRQQFCCYHCDDVFEDNDGLFTHVTADHPLGGTQTGKDWHRMWQTKDDEEN